MNFSRFPFSIRDNTGGPPYNYIYAQNVSNLRKPGRKLEAHELPQNQKIHSMMRRTIIFILEMFKSSACYISLYKSRG